MCKAERTKSATDELSVAKPRSTENSPRRRGDAEKNRSKAKPESAEMAEDAEE
jgi:hypothetical protein